MGARLACESRLDSHVTPAGPVCQRLCRPAARVGARSAQSSSAWARGDLAMLTLRGSGPWGCETTQTRRQGPAGTAQEEVGQ